MILEGLQVDRSCNYKLTFNIELDHEARKPIVILNVAAVEIDLIDAFIRRNPDCIATKQGGIKLPLEIWLRILDMPCTSLPRPVWGNCRLVQPQSIVQTPEGDFLICAPMKKETRKRCRDVRSDWEMDHYRFYLAKPDALADFKPDEDKPVPPFEQPEVKDIEDKDGIKIKMTTLKSAANLIFANLTVPDVISRIEGDACNLCWGSRQICPDDRCSGGLGREFFGDRNCGCGVVVCPLCIGTDIAEEYFNRYVADYDEGMPEEELEDWCRARFAELGYKY
ncbi:hypothetical protein F5884DRAFT_838268 [Xylogone sp. PMI_703]|nr:hypothetical protein F5884DRAFT_838268 [Xylogone sp. PMI_703]